MLESTISKAAAELGRRGGQIGGKAKTKAKAAAARQNGELGGRPRQFPKCRRYGSHRFDPKSQRCPCGYRRKDK
jgi:hypothetical protein